ncbi:MAG TPA: trypsin-like peptidase domain-containing protein [Acidimicrobiia bacterium]|nr:trypsin-like peptidase domain-containing protein [Acidimicrobiia bacterium]
MAPDQEPTTGPTTGPDKAPDGRRRGRRRRWVPWAAGGIAGIVVAVSALAGTGALSTTSAGSTRSGAAAASTVQNPNAAAGPQSGVPAASPDGTAPALDIRAVLRAVEPGVVNITDFNAGGSNGNGGSQATGEGTGMVLDAQGNVLTNAHVVSGATTVSVQVFGHSTIHQAKVLAVDTVDDVAMIQIQNPGPLTPVKLGHSAGLLVGDPVVAVGNALGLAPGGPTVTSGIISALNRSLNTGSERLTGLLQTDAPINPGNSGGPLVDSKGEVIGMNTAVSTDGQNVGFAIPIDRITPLLDSLKKGTTPTSTQGFLGVSLKPAPSGGAQIAAVTAGSPAAAAGLQVGDVITAVNGQAVATSADAADAISSNLAGSRVTIQFQRGGATQTVTATLAARPATSG